MKRLRDEENPDRLVARAAELFASQRARDVSPAMRERVRAALATGRRRRPRYALRPAIAVLLVGSAAFAAVLAARAVTTSRAVPSENRQPTRFEKPTARTTEAPTPAPSPAVTPRVPTAPTISKAAPRRPVEPPVVAPAPSESEAAPDREASLLAAATAALRREQNPERATVLLDDYARLYPNGALAEEAMALSIEAALLQHSPNAATIAARYLQRYPHGRFRALAEKAAPDED